MFTNWQSTWFEERDPTTDESPAWLKKLVQWGAGPRAIQYLVKGAKARAVLEGNYMTSMEDVEKVAEPRSFSPDSD